MSSAGKWSETKLFKLVLLILFMRTITRRTLARRHLGDFIWIGAGGDFCGQLEQETDSERLFVEDEFQKTYVKRGSTVTIPYLDRENKSLHSREYRVA